MANLHSEIDLVKDLQVAIARLERIIEIQSKYLEVYKQRLAVRNSQTTQSTGTAGDLKTLDKVA